ncbi:oxidoreductase [Stutzerimonas stutzeri]|uniref:oxidoreductase n=1 Tax=Pseudomonadaceae TaxID=135621 RepID=UPI000A81C014|nr:oxidoreductase [Stutzerimonas stutzeri]
MNLNGKTFIVVGAAGRLGEAMVDAALDCGANIVAVDQSKKALQEIKIKKNDNKNFFPIEGDITQASSIQRVIETAVEQFGSLDGAVNAAYPRNENYGRSFFDVTYEDFCENVSLHLGGYFLFMQQCAKYALVKQEKFSLVNMSSIYGVMAPRFEVYAGTSMTMPVEYAAIKSALQHLGSYVSAYTKGSRFRVNCVSPGGILAGQDQAFLDRYNSYCRDKGMLEPNDIVGTIIFLLSDASEYVCGQNIIVDDAFRI